MDRLSTVVDIDQPPSVVYGFLTDDENKPLWLSNFVRQERIKGSDGKVGWFVSFHCFTNYVKVTFYSGASLRPLPPGASKQKDVRYLDIHEDGFDEAQVARWVKQASRLPGWRM